nr:hypothetical protein [Tanacetum cinerariifolium]
MTTKTTLPLPHPPPQQSTTYSELAAQLRDLPHKIDQTVNTVVKEAVHIALQAPLRYRFRDLPEAGMKEILHQRMFESGSYKLLLEHVALYEALEASMEQENRDEFLDEKDNSRKRHRDDQDPPLPPSDLDPTKKRKHDSGASGSPRQQLASHSEQLIKDVPIKDNVNVSDSKDTNTAYLPKLKTRPDWMKPATALASSYQDPDEYKLLRQTGEMSSFINCLKTYVRYGYAFLKEIVLHRAEYKEYKISEADFKFCTRMILRICICCIFKDAYDFLFKEDYTIISKPRAVIYRYRNDKKKMMRETEVNKFSDGMLNRILKKLDHMVKYFKLFKYNPGMTTRIWSEDDRRRSKEFIEVIEHRLKLRRISRSVERFVGG